MGLPKFNVLVFKDHGRVIGPVIELVAKESCEEASALERTITEKNVDSLKNLFPKAMEADGALALVTNSKILKGANVEVGVFIGDNDSCSTSAVKENSAHFILKQSDLNHSTNGVGSMLYEIRKNSKLDPDKELAAIINIPYHLFDRHNNCGSWCRSNKENVSGVRLSNSDLFEALKNIFSQFGENAQKFVSGASSQANESLNLSICNKTPKGIPYSTTESADFRSAATVAQKNSGFNYIQKSMDRLEIPYAIRAQLRNRRERVEGTTYKSHMALFDVKIEKNMSENMENENNSLSIVHDHPYVFVENSCKALQKNAKNNQLPIIFFDLETGGKQIIKHEILQISMKCKQSILNEYITSTKSIDPGATNDNGLTFNMKCVLVAHNWDFDSRHFVSTAQPLSLLEDFNQLIHGVTDTLSLFRQKFPKRDSGYKLTVSGSELLHLPTDGAHDALFDVFMLQKLCKSYLSENVLIKKSKSFSDVLLGIEQNRHINRSLPSYASLPDTIKVSQRKKLISFEIT
ncbi:hypothetical protein PV328_004044 [Microctonus aethiopoides]|uniref:Exonuclease domain-containing protein n=1 Tax=Microctonus aethiopoides TaxID=144406 RepID=A0AA39KL99_9HYME|nr:hypothetical protein PV328_004044 [Microctonus aethiopoides]